MKVPNESLPLVTAVIPTYNRAAFLREAIDSVRAQTHANIEIIVVDDGSTDDTENVVRGYGDAVQYIRQANAGPGRARNTGIAAARGEYIALLDDDDRWLPHMLARELECFRENPGLGVVYASIRWFHNSTGIGKGEYLVPPTLNAHDLLSRSKTIPTVTAMVPRSVIKDVGGYDESLCNAEDRDFFLRICLRYPVLGIPEILAEVRDHGGNINHDIGRSYPNAKRFLHKHRRMHENCVDCARAIKAGYKHLYNTKAADLRDRSRSAAFEKDLIRAGVLATWSLYYDASPIWRRLGLGHVAQ